MFASAAPSCGRVRRETNAPEWPSSALLLSNKIVTGQLARLSIESTSKCWRHMQMMAILNNLLIFNFIYELI